MDANAAVIVLSAALAAAPGNAKMVQPTDPPSPAVVVGAQTLTIDAPELRHETMKSKAPHPFASWMPSWDPWPGKTKTRQIATLSLKKSRDEDNILVLGGFFRMVQPDSVKVTSADGTRTFKQGEDYKFNDDWGQIANIGERLGKWNEAEIKVEYDYATQRIDLIQVDAAGKASVKKGAARMVCPMIPAPDAGAKPVAGVYVAPWKRNGKFVVTKDDIYPIKPAPPVAPINPKAVAKTLAKLKDGKEAKIAFMGASITLGAEACAWWDEKIKFTEKDLAYRGRVIYQLRQKYPKATVTPIEAYRGGTTTKYGLEELNKTVVPTRPDLVLIAFGGNDVAGPIGKPPNNPAEQFKKEMLRLVRGAKGAGMEVMLVVTMQQNPWLKNKVAERWPAYRAKLLEIGREENVAVADVYSEWMNLARRGIPPFSQLHNCINHPGPFGHGVYADVILRFFE